MKIVRNICFALPVICLCLWLLKEKTKELLNFFGWIITIALWLVIIWFASGKIMSNGSASNISGRTVIVSVFADDKYTSWNFDKNSDNQTAWNSLNALTEAVDWIKRNTAQYGANTEFIYDWSVNRDLVYGTAINKDLTSSHDKCYESQDYFDEYIRKYILKEELLERYSADNILVGFFFNTDANSTTRAHALSGRDMEQIHLYCGEFGGDLCSATIAHELLHVFGTPDMYESSSKIPKKYVEYLDQCNSKEIMFGAHGAVNNWKFTELDAYYVGLINQCNEVEKWGLGKSEYQKLSFRKYISAMWDEVLNWLF